MTRERARIRILQKGSLDSAGVEPAEPAAVPQPSSRARLTRHAHARERMLAADCDIIFTQSLYRQIVGHVSSDTSVEQGGLLLGYVDQHPDRARPVVIVDWALEAQHTVADITRLTFTHETWAEFDRQTDELRERGVSRQRVGWYHSHPGHGIFLSNYDLDVCEDFRRPTQVALVVDPVSRDGGFFVRGEAGFRSNTPQGFWEWHDISEESVVRWKSMSAKRVEWEGAPLAQTPDSAAGRGAAMVKSSPGADAAEPEVTSAEGEGPTVTPLFEAPATTLVEQDTYASAERRRGKTISDAPLWAAALTAAVLLGGVVTLGVFVAQMKDELKSKAKKGDLDAINAQVADLKKEIERASAPAQPTPNPEPANTPTPTAREDSVTAGEPSPDDSPKQEPARQRSVDKTTLSSSRTEKRTERRNDNRNTRAESNTSDAPDNAQSPAKGKTPNASTAPEPTPAPKPKPPAPATSPAKSPAPTKKEQ
jgi:proteasome lid subunit RPN8/RPN11